MREAIAVVIKRDDRYLLIKRAKKGEAEDYWCPITGAVEKNETQEQAVIREAREEMGIDVKPIRRVWECFTEDKRYLLHWWFVRVLSDAIEMNPDEVKEYDWVTYPEMQKIGKMFSADLEFFRETGAVLSESTMKKFT